MLGEFLKAMKPIVFDFLSVNQENEDLVNKFGYFLDLVRGYSGDLQGIIFQNEDELSKTYTKIFEKLLLRYSSDNDKSLLTYLKIEMLKGRPHKYQKEKIEKFKKDQKFAKKCLLNEFYRLMPVQTYLDCGYEIQNSQKTGLVKGNWGERRIKQKVDKYPNSKTFNKNETLDIKGIY